MYCLDTNILLRCIVQDDPVQTPKALKFLRKAVEDKKEIYVSDVVFMETAWVLKRRYSHDATEIRSALEPLLTDKTIRFDNPARLTLALETFSKHRLSLHDAYVAACAAENDEALVVTFDQDFKKMPIRTIEP